METNLNCKYFGKCGSCTLFDLNYDEQKSLKIANSKEVFKSLYVADFDFFSSPKTHYRNRAEFGIWHEEDDIFYTMRGFKKEIVKIESCPKVDKNIYDLMPKLLKFLQKEEILRFKLFGVEFLSANSEILVILLYHKKIDESFERVAKELENELNIKIIGRSRGVKIVVSDDFVTQSLHIEEKELNYKIFDTSFVQPNSHVNKKMIEFVLSEIKSQKREDLLELYCGYGNFTLPLGFCFNKVLATEISKTSIKAAKENTTLNNISNIDFVRFDVAEFTQALNKTREFKRLKEINLDSFNFSHVFVDPPRAGLDSASLKLLKEFKNIIYISCNQQSLKRDLDELTKTHKITKFALFDQFPYTSHIESGVILEKI